MLKFSREFCKVFAAGFAAANPEANPSIQKCPNPNQIHFKHIYKLPNPKIQTFRHILGRKHLPNIQKSQVPSIIFIISIIYLHFLSSMASLHQYFGAFITMTMCGWITWGIAWWFKGRFKMPMWFYKGEFYLCFLTFVFCDLDYVLS